MADFSMPNAFAQNHLNRIIKKTEKFKIIHVFNIQEKNKSGYTVIDVQLPGHSRFVPMHVHRLRYTLWMDGWNGE